MPFLTLLTGPADPTPFMPQPLPLSPLLNQVSSADSHTSELLVISTWMSCRAPGTQCAKNWSHHFPWNPLCSFFRRTAPYQPQTLASSKQPLFPPHQVSLNTLLLGPGIHALLVVTAPLISQPCIYLVDIFNRLSQGLSAQVSPCPSHSPISFRKHPNTSASTGPTDVWLLFTSPTRDLVKV